MEVDKDKIIEQLNNIIKDLNNTIEELNNNLTDANSKIDELNSNLTDANSKIDELNSNLTDANSKIEELDNNLTDVNNKIEELNNNLTEVNNKMDEQNKTIQDLNNTIEELQNVIDTQNETINNQTTQIEELNNNLTQANNEINTLNDTVNNLTEQVNELLKALNASENTTIILNNVTDAKYDSNIIISGLLVTQKGISLSAQTVTIKINDEKPVTVGTVNGLFEYTTILKSVDEQTVSIYYEGTDDYNPSNTTMTFNVEKLDTTITIKDIEAVKKDETITVIGVLTDVNNNKLSNTVVRLLINNCRKTLKTDSEGVYTFNYTMTRVGENTITATFEANTNYNEATANITVKVNKLGTILTLNPINQVNKDQQATISGKLTDENNKTIANAQVKILINGSPKTIKTDSNGVFTYTYTMGKLGTNNVTVTYAGSSNYEASETTTTVEVNKKVAEIILDPISPVKQKQNITIKGKIIDKEGKSISGAQVKITINGSPKTLKADNDGVFTYTYT